MKFWLAALFAATALAQTLQFTDSITSDSLRGIVSFLASDALQGRDTPSPGLDVAATYIASAFRGDGLESVTGADYSQYADFIEVAGSVETLQFSISGAGEPARSIPSSSVAVESVEPAHLVNEPVFKWAPNVKIEVSLRGKVLMLRTPSDPATVRRLEISRPDAIVQLSRNSVTGGWRKGLLLPQSERSDIALVTLPAGELESIFDRLPNGLTAARVSLNIGAPAVKPARVRNVIGVLPGSDLHLRDEFILVTAHYDHLGVSQAGIYSGANDNASGVAAVLSLAAAFSREARHPKRTLVFVAFFGEEKGLLGSTWFVKHSPVSLSRVIADINFEQLGDTGSGGDVPAAALGVTGYSLSDLPQLLAPALAAAGIPLKDTPGNQSYFGRSDNYPLAQAGIPSHTFVAAYEYPDYHSVTDKWEKLNYENMAHLTRALAAAIEKLADGPEVPHWIESSKTKAYLDAWRAMHH
jgi:hypothetical protein